MLTPIDIDNKNFKKAKIGGYDINEVEDFLVEVMDSYEKLYKENGELKDRLATIQESVSYYKSVEEGITKTVENAQSTAENIKETAMRDAESIKREAEADARKNLEDIKLEISKTESKFEALNKQMQVYKIRISSMLEAQLKILNEENYKEI